MAKENIKAASVDSGVASPDSAAELEAKKLVYPKPSEDPNAEDESRLLGIKTVALEDDAPEKEVIAFEGVEFTAKSGDKFMITVPKFRFKGIEYQSAEAVEENIDVLETLIEANAFILKKI